MPYQTSVLDQRSRAPNLRREPIRPFVSSVTLAGFRLALMRSPAGKCCPRCARLPRVALLIVLLSMRCACLLNGLLDFEQTSGLGAVLVR